MGWLKIFDKLQVVFRLGGRNQKQSIKGYNNVASQSHGAEARSVLQAKLVVERHGYARTPTELFGDFDHAISNYHKFAETDAVDPPALLVTDWDVMIIQMLFRDNDPLRERVRILDGVITYKGIPLKHPTAGILQMTPMPAPERSGDAEASGLLEAASTSATETEPNGS